MNSTHCCTAACGMLLGVSYASSAPGRSQVCTIASRREAGPKLKGAQLTGFVTYSNGAAMGYPVKILKILPQFFLVKNKKNNFAPTHENSNLFFDFTNAHPVFVICRNISGIILQTTPHTKYLR
jgi:hypothetical protein